MDFRDRAAKINGRLAELQERIAATADEAAGRVEAVNVAGKVYQLALEDRINEAKDSVAAAQESLRLSAERAGDRANDKMAELQASVDAALQRREDRKLERDKDKATEQIVGVLDYAASCQDMAMLLVEESHLAVLDACVLADEYEERFGDPVDLLVMDGDE